MQVGAYPGVEGRQRGRLAERLAQVLGGERDAEALARLLQAEAAGEHERRTDEAERERRVAGHGGGHAHHVGPRGAAGQQVVAGAGQRPEV
ncbi:hypothetical protein ACFQYP_63800 [Nonomuraea antimicrobica]